MVGNVRMLVCWFTRLVDMLVRWYVGVPGARRA